MILILVIAVVVIAVMVAGSNSRSKRMAQVTLDALSPEQQLRVAQADAVRKQTREAELQRRAKVNTMFLRFVAAVVGFFLALGAFASLVSH